MLAQLFQEGRVGPRTKASRSTKDWGKNTKDKLHAAESLLLGNLHSPLSLVQRGLHGACTTPSIQMRTRPFLTVSGVLVHLHLVSQVIRRMF